VRVVQGFRKNLRSPFSSVIQYDSFVAHKHGAPARKLKAPREHFVEFRAQPPGIPSKFECFLLPFFLKLVIAYFPVRGNVPVTVSSGKNLHTFRSEQIESPGRSVHIMASKVSKCA